MLRVFKQGKPKNTGIPLPKPNEGTWHEANLIEVGTVGTWEEAQRLTKHPIVEVVVEKRK